MLFRPGPLPTLLLFAAITAAVLGAVAGVPDARAATPAAGEAAPDFTLAYATADTIVFQGQALAEAVKNGPILLAFYPADWSPGCTQEVCTLRDSYTELGDLGVTVWGISGDSVFSHRAWAEHHGLPFRLLSDAKHDVGISYGVYNAETGFNRRSVFVVGRDGRIAYADPDYSVKDGADFEALKAALAKLRG